MTTPAWRLTRAIGLVACGYLLVIGWVWAWKINLWAFLVMTCVLAAFIILVFRMLVRPR